ncbi:MAG: 3-hydroxyacyl-ACP dehydratase FabZ [Tenericutes bacterium]|nr:3-hydroxyacyl-ACP dehydratase FabZ [Mycoplasmatota bacterium]
MLYNSNQIQEIIPHRYPFLLVDAIENISEDLKTIIGRKCITANEMQFLGHFPQKHVMPGVLIVEALAQTGCVLLLSRNENKNKLAFFAGINKFRFKKQVIPGDVLNLKVTFTSEKSGVYFADATAYVNDKIVASGEIMCVLGDN